MGKETVQAILDGAQQIAVPAFVPLAEAVVFAMLASYMWSRTLVPTLAMYLLRQDEHRAAAHQEEKPGVLRRYQQGFEWVCQVLHCWCGT